MEKDIRDAKIKEKIKRICTSIENSATPKNALVLADENEDESEND